MQVDYQQTNNKNNKNSDFAAKNKSIVILAVIVTFVGIVIISYVDTNILTSKMSFSFNSAVNNSSNHKQQARLIDYPSPLQSKTPTQSSIAYHKIDKNNKFLNRFSINRPSITYLGPSQKWTQLLSYHPITYNQTYSIKIIIPYSKNGHIMLGITNVNRINQESSFFYQDTYAYYGFNGCLWAEGALIRKDQVGYSEKDLVEITVQRWNGLIQWKVNNQIRGQIYSQNLKNKDKIFVGYVEMFEKGDQIRELRDQPIVPKTAQR